MTSFYQRVEFGLRERALLSPGGKLLVAVSGGVDSMVLLHVLHALAPAWGWKLAVAHFNHHLRGRSSDADERLVRKTAQDLQLPVIVGQGNVKAYAKTSGLSLEMAARKLRHEFLAATARSAKLSTIALAHHADDQVELFFLRLLRGSGGEGLAGMKWRSPSPMDKRITLVRPLLDVPKAALEEFARAAGIAWRADATNVSLAVPRNRVRQELLPLLRAHYQPGLMRSVLRVMDLVGAETDLAADLAARWLAEGTAFPPVSLFQDLPLAVQRRVIASQLPALGLPMDFEWVEQLRALANRPVNVGLNLFAVRDARGRVTLSKQPPVAEFNPGELALHLNSRAGAAAFAGATIAWEWVAAGKLPRPIRAQAGRELFDAARLGRTVVLRHWRPGDRFQPLGMKAAVKLQDLFTNAKIPRERRRDLLVASAQGEIFWVEGLRMAERFKVTDKTRRGLLWQWQREDRSSNY